MTYGVGKHLKDFMTRYRGANVRVKKPKIWFGTDTPGWASRGGESEEVTQGVANNLGGLMSDQQEMR